MTQQVINVGTSPNDGNGDPLRTAYIKCNENFSQLFARVQDTAPTSSIGISGDITGMTAFDSVYFYYCTADYDGVTSIWQRILWDTTPW
jgi:hypothetical protein